MEENKFKKGIMDVKSTGLTTVEKATLLTVLEKYISRNPLTEIPSPWYKKVEVFAINNFVYVGAVAVVLFVVGTNTLSAALSSLPGDALYPLKVSVIEPIQYTVAVGDIAKANVETQNVSTRLAEAEVLETEGRLSTTSQKDIESRLQKHADQFNILVSNSENVGSSTESVISATDDFEEQISVHAIILNKLEASSTEDNAKHLNRLKNIIEKEVQKTTAVRQRAEERLTSGD